MARKCSTWKILAGTPVSEELRLKIRPRRGPLAARERPLMVGIWLVETVLSVESNVLLSAVGIIGIELVMLFSRKNFAFWSFARDRPDGFSYPSVSLVFDMF